MSALLDKAMVTALVATIAITACTPVTPAPEPAAPAVLPQVPADVEAARTALERFKDPVVAVREGYFSTLGCVEFPAGNSEGANMNYKPGAMGVHFLNPAYIGPTLDPAKPQILLYEWAGDSLQLTGAEWFMPVAVSSTPPTIFGQTLDGPMEGHAPILPAELHHWDLHVWMWKDNSNGLFHSTNASVKCPPGPYTFAESAPKMVHMAH